MQPATVGATTLAENRGFLPIISGEPALPEPAQVRGARSPIGVDVTPETTTPMARAAHAARAIGVRVVRRTGGCLASVLVGQSMARRMKPRMPIAENTTKTPVRTHMHSQSGSDSTPGGPTSDRVASLM